MVEFKFTAQKLNGQTINGTLSAISVGEGKKKIQRLAEKNKLNVSLDKLVSWLLTRREMY